MVRGKFQGAVTYVDANGKRLQATFVNVARKPGKSAAVQFAEAPCKKATLAPTPAVTATPSAEQTPTPTPQQTATPTPERTPAPATRPRRQLESTALRHPHKKSRLQSHHRRPRWRGSRRRPEHRSNTPGNLMPKAQLHQYQARLTILCARSPRRHWGSTEAAATLDAQTVAALDTVYQAAVKGQ